MTPPKEGISDTRLDTKPWLGDGQQPNVRRKEDRKRPNFAWLQRCSKLLKFKKKKKITSNGKRLCLESLAKVYFKRRLKTQHNLKHLILAEPLQNEADIQHWGFVWNSWDFVISSMLLCFITLIGCGVLPFWIVLFRLICVSSVRVLAWPRQPIDMTPEAPAGTWGLFGAAPAHRDWCLNPHQFCQCFCHVSVSFPVLTLWLLILRQLFDN